MGLFDKVSKQAKNLANDVSSKASEIGRDITAKAAGTKDSVNLSADEISEWAKTVPDTIHSYADRFDADEMWEKLKSTAAKVGQEMIVMVLTMYYTIEGSIKNLNEKTAGCGLEMTEILMFAGAIAYFVLPADLIPDFLPFGFSDDMAALTVVFKSGQKLFTSMAVGKANDKALDLLGINFSPELAARMTKQVNDAKKS